LLLAKKLLLLLLARTAECAEFTGQESNQVCLEQKAFNPLQSIQAFPFFGGIGND
jgi:hypothetical protein